MLMSSNAFCQKNRTHIRVWNSLPVIAINCYCERSLMTAKQQIFYSTSPFHWMAPLQNSWTPIEILTRKRKSWVALTDPEKGLGDMNETEFQEKLKEWASYGEEGGVELAHISPRELKLLFAAIMWDPEGVL